MDNSILLQRVTLPGNIVVFDVGSGNRKKDPVCERRSAVAWRQYLAKAEIKGANLFNANLYRADRVSFNGRRLVLSLGRVPYSFQKTSKDLSKQLDALGRDYYPNALFSAGIVETSDAKFVLGVRGQTVSRNAVDLLGGSYSADEMRIISGEDVFAAFRRELVEEVGVAEADLSSCSLIGVIAANYKVGIVFKVKLNISSLTLLDRFRERSDQELEDVVLVELGEYLERLSDMGGYKPLIVQMLRATKKADR